MTIEKIKAVVFEGGGVLGCSYVGCIQILEKYNIVADYFAGSSVGCLLAVLMACRQTSADIREILNKINFQALEDRGKTIFNDGYNLYTKFGFCYGKVLENLAKQILFDITGDSQITFEGLYLKYGTFLCITGSNISTGCLEYFTHLTQPNMTIEQAIRISCSYPYVFKAVNYNNSTYIDGGFMENFPIGLFNTMFKPEEILGFKFINKPDCTQIHLNNIIDYSKSLITILYNQAQKLHISRNNWDYIIKIDVGKHYSMEFTIDKAAIEELINTARSSTEDYVKNHL